MKTIVLDTSFLLAALQKRVDVLKALKEFFEEPIALVVLKPCLNELSALQGRARAKTMVEYLRQHGVRLVKTLATSCDEAILDYAAARGGVVCSLDRELRKRLKRMGVQVITLRDKKLVLA